MVALYISKLQQQTSRDYICYQFVDTKPLFIPKYSLSWMQILAEILAIISMNIPLTRKRNQELKIFLIIRKPAYMKIHSIEIS